MIDDIILKEIKKEDFLWASELHRKLIKKGVATSEPTIARAIRRLAKEGKIEVKIRGRNKVVKYVYQAMTINELNDKILKVLSKDMWVSFKQIKDNVPLSESELMKMMKALEDSKKVERLQIGDSISWKKRE